VSSALTDSVFRYHTTFGVEKKVITAADDKLSLNYVIRQQFSIGSSSWTVIVYWTTRTFAQSTETAAELHHQYYYFSRGTVSLTTGSMSLTSTSSDQAVSPCAADGSGAGGRQPSHFQEW